MEGADGAGRDITPSYDSFDSGENIMGGEL
jgi:hypothetical protein